MECLITHKSPSNHYRNRAWTLWDQLNLLPVNIIIFWDTHIILTIGWVQSVSKRKRIQSHIEFLYEIIFTKFSVPWDWVTNHDSQFTSQLFQSLDYYPNLHHRNTKLYHSYANWKVEAITRILRTFFPRQFKHNFHATQLVKRMEIGKYVFGKKTWKINPWAKLNS